MKALREHRVQLSGPAVKVLDAARALGDGDCLLVFPTAQGKPLRKYAVARRSGQQAMNSLRASFAPYWESIQRTLFPRLGPAQE